MNEPNRGDVTFITLQDAIDWYRKLNAMPDSSEVSLDDVANGFNYLSVLAAEYVHGLTDDGELPAGNEAFLRSIGGEAMDADDDFIGWDDDVGWLLVYSERRYSWTFRGSMIWFDVDVVTRDRVRNFVKLMQ